MSDPRRTVRRVRVRLRAALSALTFTVGASAAAGTEHPIETLRVVLHAPAGEVERAADGVRILRARGFGVRAVPGEPRLPQRLYPVAIPPDAVVRAVRFIAPEADLRGRFRVEPAAMLLPSRDLRADEFERARVHWERTRAARYASDEFYPAATARHLGVGSFRRYRFVTVEWTPWRFAPRSGRMRAARELTVEIDIERDPAVIPPADRSADAAEAAAELMLMNMDAVRDAYNAAPAVASAGSSDYTYLVLCDAAVAADVATLIDWKRSIGYRVKTILLGDILADPAYAAYDTPGRIRAYLRDRYLDWGSLYLLIVGDHTTIPMRKCTVTYDNGDSHVCYTDQYYGELSLPDSQSWDANRNGVYGQHGNDPIDWVMELKVGRLPFDDAAGIRAYAQAAAAFEMDTGNWKKSVLFASALFDCTGLDNKPGIPLTDGAYIAKSLIDMGAFDGWFLRKGFEKEGVEISPLAADFNLTLAHVESEWNGRDFGLVNFSGHGDPHGPLRLVWNADTDGNGMAGHGEYAKYFMFDRARLGQVAASKPSVVYLCGCNNGRWDDPNAIGKALLRGPAVATVSSSVDSFHFYGWTQPTDGGGDQGMQVVWNQFAAGSFPRAGDATAMSKWGYRFLYGESAGGTVMLHIGNLYGDPALNLNGVADRPNLRQYWPGGWTFAAVPRATNDATAASCLVTPTLPGDASATYLSYAVENSGTVTAYDIRVALRVDEEELYNWKDWNWIDPGAPGTRRNLGPFTVKGGRHTLQAVYDPDHTVVESSETDNAASRQYVWSPCALTRTAPAVRFAAPPRGAQAIPNCDGYETDPNPARSVWGAVGLMPFHADADHVLRLYQDYGGSQSGFSSCHAECDAPPGQTGMVLFNTAAVGSPGPFLTGVFRDSDGNSAYVLQLAASAALVGLDDTWGPFSVGSGGVVGLHHINLSTGLYEIVMNQADTDTVDLGLSVYSPAVPYAAKMDTPPGSYANETPAGGSERCVVKVATPGAYAIAVWKTRHSTLPDTGTYTLTILRDPHPPRCRIVRCESWQAPAYHAGIEWTVEAGWAYAVEYANGLGGWRPTPGVFHPEEDGTCAWIDDGSETGGLPKRARFFRVVPSAP